ncbi:unnamed protein product [Notodromas monacha]|uniref:Peptidyl-prolyl cis-trans isomerase n=1 Tax=Notodromas monacha TaxID=399045 RepID=A0A7R9GDG7_9CRUS|nr:unnamed protein product [Notodromas monacha]CAG0916951.1 unnamed protein product [Notodromas monacha]
MSDGEVLPPGWEKRLLVMQNYYLNTYTKDSQWDAPTEAAKPPSSEKVQCSHLLVKHRDSRRPSSWKEENITRTRDEALELIEGFREKLDAESATFEELASVHSDCSSAKRGGDLGPFGRGVRGRGCGGVEYTTTGVVLVVPLLSFSQSSADSEIRWPMMCLPSTNDLVVSVGVPGRSANASFSFSQSSADSEIRWPMMCVPSTNDLVVSVGVPGQSANASFV